MNESLYDNEELDLCETYEIYDDIDPVDELAQRKSKRLNRRKQFIKNQRKQAHIVKVSQFPSGYIKRESAKGDTYYMKASQGSKFHKKQSSRAFRNDALNGGRMRSLFKKMYDYWWNLW